MKSFKPLKFAHNSNGFYFNAGIYSEYPHIRCSLFRVKIFHEKNGCYRAESHSRIYFPFEHNLTASFDEARSKLIELLRELQSNLSAEIVGHIKSYEMMDESNCT